MNRNRTEWPEKGQTSGDNGAGSRAKVLASSLSPEEQSQVQTGYADCVEVLGDLPDNVQRCIGFCLGTDYDLGVILDKANESPAVSVTKIDDEAWARVKTECDELAAAGKPVAAGDIQQIYQRHVDAIRAERKDARAESNPSTESTPA